MVLLPTGTRLDSCHPWLSSQLELKAIIFLLPAKAKMLPKSVFVVALLLILSCWSVESQKFLNDTDRMALLEFKKGITNDPYDSLAAWNSSLQFCDWTGVSCDHLRRRVVALDLRSRGLAGSLSPHLGNLSELTTIYLHNNNLQGLLPQELGRLSKLQLLLLSNNSFSGEIPANISNCRQLQLLLLGRCNFEGSIPPELGSLTNLQGIHLHLNKLTGVIPPSLSNMTSLVNISLALNNLQGSLPNDIGRLSRLGFINIYANSISGTFPPSLFNITSLYYLATAQNNLRGSLPSDMGITLPNLQVLGGGLNGFTGSIPASLSNATRLRILDFADCLLSGSIPVSLGSLNQMVWFNFGNNSLEVDESVGMNFITYLSNYTYLEVLGLDSNLFSGELPRSIANLSSHLSMLLLGTNQLSGTFPPGIENYANLTFLSLEGNFFRGEIPTQIGRLYNLQKMFLYGNSFSGVIPPSIGNMTQLSDLRLQGNNFSGSISSSLGKCIRLQKLDLSKNELNGRIPSSIMHLSSLSISLNLSNNMLEGSLPNEVGSLASLGELDLSDNKLSGEIPSAISSCRSLERLKLQGNSFQGTIPLFLSSLSGIRELDLSRNNFSGQIPKFIEKFTYLQYLNLSFNALEGEVPTIGVFSNSSAFSVSGNTGLCGGLSELKLQQCSMKTTQRHRKPTVIVVVASLSIVAASLLVICLSLRLYKKRISKRRSARSDISASPSPSIDIASMGYERISYAELHQATSGFSSANLIGEGGAGSVYKATNICDRAVVAVKVFNLIKQGASKSFMYECQTLRNVRHRNLVKIITSCCSVDFEGNEFMALVYDYMPNGNLDQWLHPKVEEDAKAPLQNLSLATRLTIASDVASALEYLHLHCHVPVVHSDLKPSNVLLDDDMVAHIGDFGLASFLVENSSRFLLHQTRSFSVQGSIGYLPPEYGMGRRPSRAGDIYSFGIILLEMFTGKRPTDEMFKDGLTLHQYARNAFPNRVMEIIDPTLLSEEFRVKIGESKKGLQECLAAVVRIGITCSAESVRNRMDVGNVATEMHMVRDIFMGNGIYGDKAEKPRSTTECTYPSEEKTCLD